MNITPNGSSQIEHALPMGVPRPESLIIPLNRIFQNFYMFKKSGDAYFPEKKRLRHAPEGEKCFKIIENKSNMLKNTYKCI